MVELLYQAGIRSRHAALLGVPFQGNHSLVQVYLGHGRPGLFDPTFGVFWYSRRRKRPVPFERLPAHPSVSDRTLYKSVDRKRVAASDPVVPIAGIAAGYTQRAGYNESPDTTGLPRMDWRRAFAERGAPGWRTPASRSTLEFGSGRATRRATESGTERWRPRGRDWQ